MNAKQHTDLLVSINCQILREAFNGAKKTTRILVVLSPTCPECLNGYQTIKVFFRKFQSATIRGFVVWIPMLSSDTAKSASIKALELKVPRIRHGWDKIYEIGNSFMKTLSLHRTAWDIYLIYKPGSIWKETNPPYPSFWMHQLDLDSGADPKLRLDSDLFSREFSTLKDLYLTPT